MAQSVILTHDKENRQNFKNSLSDKVEMALTPPVLLTPSEPIPIEIIEKYAKWLPRQLSVEPMEELPPEFKKELPFISQGETLKRQELKELLLNKVEEALIPAAPEPEPASIQIIEKYAHGIPKIFSAEPEANLYPESNRKQKTGIPQREIGKRQELKADLLAKVEESLIPTVPEQLEPMAPIEIIEKYAQGIPKQSFDPIEQMLPERVRDSNSFVLDSSIPGREARKEGLLNKVTSSVAQDQIKPEAIELVGYAQRSVSPFEPEFSEAIFPLELLYVEETVEAAIEYETQEPVVPVLRLPSNYEDLNEAALYGLMIRLPELMHTSDSANLALDILNNRSSQAVEFQIVEFQPEGGQAAWLRKRLSEPFGDKCTFWPYAKDSDGYGAVKVGGVLKKVHHYTMEIRGRERPSGPINLLHKCNNRACFNPKHLKWGTISANATHREASKVATAIEPLVAVCQEPKDPLLIPDNWQDIPPATLRADLFQMNKEALPEEVDFTLAYLYQKPIQPEILGSLPEEEDPIDLPEDFKAWKPQDQHIYLTKTLKLTPERAGRVQWTFS